MTSGIYDYSTDPKVNAELAADPAKVWPHEELVAVAAAAPCTSRQGRGWHYSNSNTVLLGLIVEQVTARRCRGRSPAASPCRSV